MAEPIKHQHFTAAEGVSELIIREGAAPVLHERRPLTYAGRLDTPRQFLNKKLGYYKPEDATLVIDKMQNVLTFYGNEHATPTDKAEGRLIVNPDLTAFRINDDKTWSFSELHNFLKLRRYFFHSKEAHVDLLRNLLNFKTQVTTIIENKQDNTGNRQYALEQRIKDNPLGEGKFILRLPLYQGYEPSSFTVELGFVATDGAISIFLLSDELLELLLTERDALMQAEEDYFRLWNCAIITKS